MDKVFQVLGQKQVKGDIGVEIEVENCNIDVADRRWKSDRDGSLRGINREYILRAPLPIDEVRDALEALAKELEGAPISFSFRTSVHVHLNVQQLTHTQVLNLIYLYLLLEEPLINYCGEARKGNRFCLRLTDAEGLMGLLVKMAELNGGQAYPQIQHNMYRYAAINLEAINKYGSVEFRGMRGTMEVDVIDTWCKTLYRLREMAVSFKDPKQICQEVRNLGSRPFLKAVLEDLAKPYLYPRIDNDLQKSFSLTMDIPYNYKYVPEVKVEDPYEKLKAKALGVPAAAPMGFGLDILGRPVNIGDVVEVSLKPRKNGAAQYDWVPDMGLAIGHNGVVVNVDPLGARLHFDAEEWNRGTRINEYGWPYSSLVVVGRRMQAQAADIGDWIEVDEEE